MTNEAIESLRSFYAEHRQQLYTYAVSITSHRESAEDAIQQAFQQLLRRGRPPAELRPYVFRCVRNAALDGMRRAAVRRDSIFAEESVGRDRAATLALAAEVAALVQGLEADERESIVLKIYSGLTFREIADLRGVPVATVASWYRRGLERIRALMEQIPHERS